MQRHRWWPEVRAIVDAVRDARGTSRPDLRRWAESRAAGDAAGSPEAEVPDVLVRYADLVETAAYQTTDAHVNDLRAHGFSDDEIFELTAAIAVGAGRRRLERALAALEEAGE